MALTVRKVPDAILFALAAAHNAHVRFFVDTETTYAHYDITSTPGGDYTAPTSTPITVVHSSTANLPAVILLAEELRARALEHLLDDVAHVAADAARYATLLAVPAAVDQGTVDTLLNAIKAQLNDHEGDTDIHPHADGTNTIGAADATGLASSQTLAAQARTKFLAHVVLAPTSPSIKLVAA